MSTEPPATPALTSPDGRYRLVVETGPRLLLKDTTTGEVLFDAPDTRLTKTPDFRARSVFFEFTHAGQPGLLEVTYADRTYISEPHDFPHPLSELPDHLIGLTKPPPVYTTTGAIVRSSLWFIGFIGVTATFIYIALFRPLKHRDWWWLTLGIVFSALCTWACFMELQTLLRRPRRK
jgi:hypothetical protein